MEALQGVVKSVPEWHNLLDTLNGKIARRQIELAQLDENRPPTARSLKKSGSTESLRPKDAEDIFQPPTSPQNEKSDIDRTNIFPPTPPTSKDPGQFEVPNPAPLPAPLLHASTTPTPFFRRLSGHQTSPTPAQPTTLQKNLPIIPSVIPKPTVLRKRKTASIISAESQVPKYRTRSMIIVYYDSAVQDAFEELVKYISSSRNAMRKGKMAARMAEMRRLAELEVNRDSDEDSDEDMLSLAAAYRPSTFRQQAPMPRPTPPKNSPSTPNNKDRKINADLSTSPGGVVEADDACSSDEIEIPQLKFVSTRRMGPSRDGVSGFASAPGGPSSPGGRPAPRAAMQRPGARNMSLPPGVPSALSAPGSNTSIFDELDAGLEWCQSMCEHAAHQFLRDGECGIEIQGIKRRLGEVKEAAQREIDIKASMPDDKTDTSSLEEEAKEVRSRVMAQRPTSHDSGHSREFREICMRKPNAELLKDQFSGGLPPTDGIMEVDEGVEDMDLCLNWIPAKDRMR